MKCDCGKRFTPKKDPFSPYEKSVNCNLIEFKALKLY